MMSSITFITRVYSFVTKINQRHDFVTFIKTPPSIKGMNLWHLSKHPLPSCMHDLGPTHFHPVCVNWSEWNWVHSCLARPVILGPLSQLVFHAYPAGWLALGVDFSFPGFGLQDIYAHLLKREVMSDSVF